jgi:Carboxypeptidase regulatory-like domain
LPPGAWLQSVRAGDQDVTETGLDLSGGAAGPIQITLGLGGGVIEGVVNDAKSQPAPGSMVTLVPDPLKPDRYDLNRTSVTDQNGRFTLRNIPPGEYKLFAWESIEPGAATDPEFLKSHDSSGKKLSVKVRSQEQVSLVQITAEASAPN